MQRMTKLLAIICIITLLSLSLMPVASAAENGAVTVLDTTAIQRFLAVLSHPDGIGKAIK